MGLFDENIHNFYGNWHVSHTVRTNFRIGWLYSELRKTIILALARKKQ